MVIPAPPVAPTVPLPRWAYNSGTSEKRDPGEAKRLQGWGYYNQSSTKLGETPPYQTENFNKNLCGQWFEYFNKVVDYVTQFYGNVTSSDSNYSNFLSLSYDNSMTITSPNNPSLVQLNVTRASRYPTNLSSSPWDGMKFICPVQDYYDVSFQCVVGFTPIITTDVNSKSSPYNAIDISIYKNHVSIANSRVGGFNESNNRTYVRLMPMMVTQTIYCQKGDILQFYLNNVTLKSVPASFCPMYYGNFSTYTESQNGSSLILVNSPGIEAVISWNFSP